MLIEFSVTNFRSFKEQVTLSLLPAAIREKRKVTPILIEDYRDLSLLPSAILYGPNNSGKSNLFTAAAALRWLVVKSGNFNSDKDLPNEVFVMDLRCKDLPTVFEIDFLAKNGKRYEYSVAFKEQEIINEELIRYESRPKKTTRLTLFSRNKQEVKFPGNSLKGSKSFNFEKNQLVLSRGDIEGNDELQEVYSFFSSLKVHQLAEADYVEFLAKNYSKFVQKDPNSEIKQAIDQIIAEFDKSIIELRSAARDVSKVKFPEDIPDKIKEDLLDRLKSQTYTIHRLYEKGKDTGDTVELSLSKQSTGMRKFLAILPEVLPILENGGVLFLDELNVSLHTEITTFIINLFKNPKTNPKHAQLITTTHDMMLLNRSLFDRDQIYVTEKDEFGASVLYAFSDYNFGKMRSPNLAQYYESGKVGGVPQLFVSYINSIITKYLENGQQEKKSAER
jgi:AAA15 family ATPase/GTPase